MLRGHGTDKEKWTAREGNYKRRDQEGIFLQL
jgi:hypothetical protein